MFRRTLLKADMGCRLSPVEGDEGRYVRGGRTVTLTEDREELRLRGRNSEEADDEVEGGEEEFDVKLSWDRRIKYM